MHILFLGFCMFTCETDVTLKLRQSGWNAFPHHRKTPLTFRVIQHEGFPEGTSSERNSAQLVNSHATLQEIINNVFCLHSYITEICFVLSILKLRVLARVTKLMVGHEPKNLFHCLTAPRCGF